MIHYTISNRDQLPYHLRVEVSFKAPQLNPEVVIPFWRPGRYEAGFFPRNYSGFQATAEGKKLPTVKKDPNTVIITAEKGTSIDLTFSVYAHDLTAGNTFSCEDFILINPINSLVFVPGSEDEPCRLKIDTDTPYQVATAMKQVEALAFEAPHMQALMDSPILLAPDIRRLRYSVEGKDFHIHILGEVHINESDLLRDFEAFTRTQVVSFDSLPVDQYHFMILLFPYQIYHGVEHENSTVIIYGPSEKLTERSAYLQLLGVSSHELYHTWNVKYIRPQEWMPYDFSRWGFSRLGYVAEGVTTYMGDLMLWLSGVFSDEEFFTELSSLYQRHLRNEARNRANLADSSVDTWVDGYQKSMPRRKLNIYTEGALLAFVCDTLILTETNGHKSLISAMARLYKEVQPEKGYSEVEYWQCLEAEAACSFSQIRADLVDGVGHWDEWLNQTFEKAGISVELLEEKDGFLKHFGADVRMINGRFICINVLEGSPAEKAGLWFDDEILEANGQDYGALAEKGVDGLNSIRLKVRSQKSHREMTLKPDDRKYGGTIHMDWSKDGGIFKNRKMKAAAPEAK